MKSSLILVLILLITSCTEEISQSLEPTASTTSGTTTTTTVDPYFEVTLANNNVEYVLHKAGSLSDACKFSSSTGFSAANYVYTDSTYAMDCFLDINELDLYFNDLTLNVSFNGSDVCKAVEMKPFSFWQFQPGSTSANYHQVTSCDAACNSLPAYSTICANLTKTYTDATLVTAYTGSTTCKYNHTLTVDSRYNPQNCDEGSVTISTVKIVDDGAGACSISVQGTTTTECGGDHLSCLNGPAKDIVANFPTKYKSITTYAETSDVQSTSYTIPNAFDKGYTSNRYAANFMRLCADDSTNKSAASTFNTLAMNGADLEEFGTNVAASTVTASGYTFPANIGAYASYPDMPYADNPFRGFHYNASSAGSLGYYSPSPYYSIKCLDRAFDVKLQIRLFIREWDEELKFSSNTTNASLALTSDVGLTDPLMDDSTENQLGDWDDFINGKVDSQCVDFGANYSSSNFPGADL